MSTSFVQGSNAADGRAGRVLPEGSVREPTYYEGPEDIQGDVRLRGRYFTYRTELGLVAGCNTSILFAIDRPVRQVWPYFKDFNLWHTQHHYSGVVGDLEGKTFHLSLKPNDPARFDLARHQYQVVRVIPEYLIVIHQPVQPVYEGLPGFGLVSPGFHMFALHEHGGATQVSVVMNHASVMEDAVRGQGISVAEALHPWSNDKALPEWHRKWRDDFIPGLKALVYGREE